MSKKKLLKITFSVLVIVTLGYMFATRLSNSWESVNETINFQFNALSVLAVLLFALAVVVSGVLWRLVLKEIASDDKKMMSKLESTRVHIGAWLLKYVPGQVGSAVYKISWGTKKGFNKTDVAMSFVYENLFLTIISLLPTSIILLLFGNLEFGVDLILLVIFISSILLLFSHPIMRKFVSITAKRFSIDPKIIKLIKTSKVIELSVLYSIPRIINGLGFVVVASSVMTINLADIVPLVAAYTLAGIIGIYAIFVPSGLGVREAMIVVFATGLIGAEEAIILAILARFYATITDGFLAVYYSVTTGKERREKV